MHVRCYGHISFKAIEANIKSIAPHNNHYFIMHLKTATILFALSSTVLAEYITVFHASCSPAPPAAYNDSLRNWRQRICETELKGSYYDEGDQCQVVDPVTADTKKVYHPTLGAAGQPNIKTRCTWS
ncbi:uncharacterized protein CCOS01_01993 [Colletotrichum costaricense]|uniref:Uncharacterized protein n=2 Tax=Colletotrichum acutatum species complex TaxID=2707335 RepID=A0AAI9Z8G8_9PEZI|nr:uncharacterized protein CCOS01_01993 [Colletotrichum costaricense]XP_060383866.1 uncharacterized protein CTAM01_05622 [Colletotrichum tamarilloi]KAK1502184.1 hypothetical protein CTAM01_05622 [Colletotrichum tamarilloi]KAK1536673.1 hypothetical protein CCOS01_01993 [Colletotrichum costaricense]